MVENNEAAATAEESLWTIRQVAAYLNVSVWMAYRLRTIPRLKVGGAVRFVPGAVRAWARKQKAS